MEAQQKDTKYKISVHRPTGFFRQALYRQEDGLELLTAEGPGCVVIHYRKRVIHSYAAPAGLLNLQRCQPRTVDVLCGHVLQFGHVGPDVDPLWIELLAKRYWTVVLHRDSHKRTAGTSHPATAGDAWLVVQQQLFKYVLAPDPGDPQISAR